MKRLVTAVVVVVVVVVFAVYLWHSRQQERLRQEQEMAARRTVASLRLEALITRTGARTDWEGSIAGKSALMPFEIYTMDLQRAWIGSRPILFLGTIKDVSAAGDDQYRVLFGYSPRGRLLLASERLRLDLLCSKALLDPLLAAQGKRKFDFSGAVAVVARVERVAAGNLRDSEGVGDSVFTGFGECVDADYIRDVRLP